MGRAGGRGLEEEEPQKPGQSLQGERTVGTKACRYAEDPDMRLQRALPGQWGRSFESERVTNEL